MAEESLAKLRGSKNVYLRHIKNLERNIEEFVATFDRTDEKVIKLNSLKLAYTDKNNKIKELDDQILESITSNEIDKELDANLLRENITYDIFAKIEHCFSKVTQNKSATKTNSTSLHCKLPKIEIPKFNGDILLWQGFYDSFKSTIDQNERISDVEKFSYLRSFLTDSALSLISGLTLSDNNYHEAFTILKDRYNNEQVLVNAYMKRFVELPVVKSEKDIQGLRKMYDQIQASIRNLNSLEKPIETYGLLLVHLLTEKLPTEIRIIISRKFENKIWDLKEMLEILKIEIEAKERSIILNEKPDIRNNRTPDNRYSLSALHNSTFEKRKQCVFCELSNHSSSQCRKITEPKARRQILRDKKLCFICFRQGHNSRFCNVQYDCVKCKNGKHHYSLCLEDKNENKGSSYEQTTNTLSNGRNNILLQTARTDVFSLSESSHTFATLILDSGSQRTYITEKLRKKLQLPIIRKEMTSIQGFGQSNSIPESVDIVSLKIKCLNNTFIKIEAICKPIITVPLSNQNIPFAVEKYEYLKHLRLADNSKTESRTIDLLIGLDYYYSIMSGEIISGKNNCEPVAINSKLGWVLCGTFYQNNTSNINLCTHMLFVNSKEVKNNFLSLEDQNVRRIEMNNFLNTDTFDIKEQNDVYNSFKETTFCYNNRYSVELPFKSEVIKEIIPDNYSISKKRLHNLKSKLDKNKELFKDYDKIIKDYENEGIIETVDIENDFNKISKIHYLPHRPVIRNDKQTTKVRIVYDASSKAGNEPCLNDLLESGPCLLPLLWSILMRFRIGKIAVVADIKQAFLQINIVQKHRDYLRFLWYDNIDDPDPSIVVKRFCRVIWGLTSSPFLLNGTIQQHAQKYLYLPQFTEIIIKLLRNLYVDDTTNTFDDVTEAFAFYKGSNYILSQANFELRKWSTNNVELQSLIKENIIEQNEEESYEKIELGNDQKYRTVLGINWDNETDSLVFDFENIINTAEKLVITKRNILRISAMFFDPLGFIIPIILTPKIIFKELCINKFGWDDIINNEFSKTWTHFLKQLKSLQAIIVDRNVLCCQEREVSLHGFSDASGKAYGAVVYVKVVCKHGVRVKLWSAKGRLVPVKLLTIPRLELLGCVLLSRLMVVVMEAVKNEVTVKDWYCWTDSQISLWWIKKEGKWKTWVENRVKVIRKNVEGKRWLYVPTSKNPADIASREVSLKDFSSLNLWWEGPQFLKLEANCWPSQDYYLPTNIDREEKVNQMVMVSTAGSVMGIGQVVEVKRYGCLKKLLRVSGYVMRFVNNMKAVVRLDIRCKDGDLASDELLAVELLWVKYEQMFLVSAKNFNKLKFNLNIFKNSDNVLRCRTRITELSNISYNTRFPILLRNDSYFTKLIILSLHKQLYHVGTEMVLSNLRNNYWITQGRKTVKSILRKCVTCKLLIGKPAIPPETPSLPSFRVNCSHVFENVGLDYAGPLYYKNVYKTPQSMDKCYILLFTCSVSRAIHLELVENFKANTLLLALRRFIARYGAPRYIISDNFKTFKSVEVKKFISENGIQWKFILERSPWWGGFYERLIGIAKMCLKKVLLKSYLTFIELETVLSEVSYVLNTRPLTYINDDEIVESISPNKLIYGRELSMRCNEDIEPNDVGDRELKDMCNNTKNCISHFKRRFINEYLTSLKERHSYQVKKFENDNKLCIGDIVLIKDSNAPRLNWRKGKIQKFLYSNDKLVRGVEILTYQKKFGKTTVLNRPIQHVVPLEICTSETNVSLQNDEVVNNLNDSCQDDDVNNITNNDLQKEVKEVRSSKRVAAKNAKLFIKAMME